MRPLAQTGRDLRVYDGQLVIDDPMCTSVSLNVRLPVTALGLRVGADGTAPEGSPDARRHHRPSRPECCQRSRRVGVVLSRWRIASKPSCQCGTCIM
jgi:hypothetical protein